MRRRTGRPEGRSIGQWVAALAVLAFAVPAPAPAQEADPFVSANVEWALDHAMAHALIHAFDLSVPVEEDATDAFASASVSARHEESEAAARLVEVAALWSREAERATADGETDYFRENDLDTERGFRVLCVANGADPGIADAALGHVDVPDGGFDACKVDRDLATEEWDVLIGPNTLYDDEPPADVGVRYEPAGLPAAREALEATGAMEALATEAARTYALFDPLAIVGRGCGEPDVYFAPDKGEIVMCYEFVAHLMTLGAEADNDPVGSVDGTTDAVSEAVTDAPASKPTE